MPGVVCGHDHAFAWSGLVFQLQLLQSGMLAELRQVFPWRARKGKKSLTKSFIEVQELLARTEDDRELNAGYSINLQRGIPADFSGTARGRGVPGCHSRRFGSRRA
jgi:hypothetical protein